jgi:hypothetical protein
MLGAVAEYAHEPIVDGELFGRVQRVKIPRGRKAKSDRLLARLGVLRQAEQTLARAQAKLAAALLAFEGLDDEGAARKRLLALREERDSARERVERFGEERPARSGESVTIPGAHPGSGH